MRIAQVAPLHESVPPKMYGGTERVVSYLTEELVRLGHDVTLFASGDSVTSARLIAPCRVGLRLDEECTDPAAHHTLELEMVAQRLREFDIVHFHIDNMHLPLARRLRKPCVTTLHGRLDLPDLYPLYREFSDAPLISISDSQRRPLAWCNWQRTIYHGLPENLHYLREKPGEYLVFLGRISPEKGPDHAIEMAKRFGMKLKIAAKVDKKDEEYFESRIKPMLDSDLIEFIGEVTEEDKGDVLGNAYAMLFPINWPEPFGIVMIEAMATGTPVIAYPYGAVPEVMKDGVSGYMVDNIDEGIAKLEAIATFNRRACREYFLKRFSATRMAQDYLDVYRHLQETSATTVVA